MNYFMQSSSQSNEACILNILIWKIRKWKLRACISIKGISVRRPGMMEVSYRVSCCSRQGYSNNSELKTYYANHIPKSTNIPKIKITLSMGNLKPKNKYTRAGNYKRISSRAKAWLLTLCFWVFFLKPRSFYCPVMEREDTYFGLESAGSFNKDLACMN